MVFAAKPILEIDKIILSKKYVANRKLDCFHKNVLKRDLNGIAGQIIIIIFLFIFIIFL